MKKVLFVLFLMISFPLIVSAYGIDDFYINATILDNGDLEVEEYFNLNGYFNGMERIYYYKNSNTKEFDSEEYMYGGSSIHNADDVIIEEVRGVNISSDFNFDNISGDIFEYRNTAEKGSYGVYTLSNVFNGKSLLIYLPSNKNRAFYVKYKLTNMAIIHEDVAELGWTVFSSSFNESINNLVINVNIPNNNNIIRIWAHGPINGESKIISNNLVQANILGLNSNTAIDVRVVFDKDVIYNSNKRTHVNALEKIIRYEKALADKANSIRENEIEANFRNLNNTPSRSNYDLTLSAIAVYNNKEKTDEYLSRLYEYKNRVDKYEYGLFNNEIEIINNKVRNNQDAYKLYLNLSEYPENVFDLELKMKMLSEIEVVKNIIIKKEILFEIYRITIALLIIVGAFIIKNIPKYLNKRIKKTEPLYIRDIPTDLSLVAASILIDKKVSSYEITASILDLIKRKIIVVDEANHNILNINEDMVENMNDNDLNLIKMIFDNEKSINLKDKKRINEIRFACWKGSFIKELKDKGYVTIKTPVPVTINIVTIIIIILSLFTDLYFIGLVLIILYSLRKYKIYSPIVMLMCLNFHFIKTCISTNHFIMISIIFNIISTIICYIVLRRVDYKLDIKITKTGKIMRNKIFAFRNFLNDFGRLNEKEIPEVSLWENYLIYATAFGIGDKVLKSMKMMVNTNDVNIQAIFNTYIDYSTSFDSISRNIITFTMPKTEITIPESNGDWSSSDSGGSYSSSDGFGGGFSGGSDSGGSFGGGSGGGRF